MAAVLKVFGCRMQSCVLRTYLWKPSVIFGTRVDYKSGPCKWNLYGRRNVPQRRNLSTKVGKAKRLVHDDIGRRIMVVLRRKEGELLPQLNEDDLLNYFSNYGEIEGVTWVRNKKTDPSSGRGFGYVSFTSAASLKEAVASRNHILSGRDVWVYPVRVKRESERTAPMQSTSKQSESVRRASAPPARSVSAPALSAWIASAGTASVETELAKELPALLATEQTTADKESSAPLKPAASVQTVSDRAPPARSVSAQALSAGIASVGTASVETELAKELPALLATEQPTADKESSAPSKPAASVQTVSDKAPPAWSVSAQALSAWIASAGTASVETELAKELPALLATEQTTVDKESSAPLKPAVSDRAPPAWSVSAQALSAWIASTGTASMQTELAKEVPLSGASMQTTAAKESSAAATPVASAQAASVQAGYASAASAQPVSGQTGPARTASMRMSFPRIKTPEDEKRKILVTRRRGCGGKMTLKNVHDYFSAFGKIEHFHETKDLMYITFETADSVERVMLVPNHIINDVMVQISLAYSDKQRKQLRLEKAIHEVKVKQNPASMKIAEKEGRKIVFMTPARFRDSINEKSLEDYFSSYGEIEEIFLMESKGYGFITFKDAFVAKNVLADGDHKVEDSEVYVKISLASHKNPMGIEEEERKFFVSNISGETSEIDIWKHFSKFGKVAEVVFANEGDSYSCVVAFEFIRGKMESVIDAFHQIPTQRDALEVKVGEDSFSAQPSASKLHASNIPEDTTLEMLRDYFEEFGHVQYLGFTDRYSDRATSTLRCISVAFHQESALEKALNKSVHEINGYKLKVKRGNYSMASRPSDFLSLGVLITNLPENLDEFVVKDYLFRHSCRVKSVRFLSPTVCIASLWNLRDVNRLVEVASSDRHVIGGNPVLLRRLHWVKEQDEGLKLDDTVASEMKN